MKSRTQVKLMLVLVIALTALAIWLAACQPTVIEIPATTTKSDVSIEQITDYPNIYRLYDRQERVLCYVVYPGSSGAGIDCLRLEE